MTQPNILWIYCDELRTDALGCYGNAHFKPQTPHIDSLAAQGVRLANCFCNSPVCVPSRASVKTGLYCEDLGVYHNEACSPLFHMRTQPITFPEVFAQHGYVTANFGKEHIPQQMHPWQYSNRDGSANRMPADVLNDPQNEIIRPPGMKNVVGGRFPADRPYPPAQVTANTLQWLESATEPFLLRVSYVQPHTPVVTPPPFDSLYLHENFPDPRLPNTGLSAFERRYADIAGTYGMTEREVFLNQAYYYGLVSWVDSQVGQLIEALRRSGRLDTTIIVFDADHGRSLGDYGRLQKQTFAPESHRVPRIIRWPGAVPAGQVSTDICESLDLARTLFDLAGIPCPDQFKGRNVLSDPAPEAVFSTIGYGLPESKAFPHLNLGEFYGGRGWPRRACIRTNRWRLDKSVRIDGRPPMPEEEDAFLVDWQADPRECHNLAHDPACAGVLAALNTQLDQHLATAVAEYPPEMLVLHPGMVI